MICSKLIGCYVPAASQSRGLAACCPQHYLCFQNSFPCGWSMPPLILIIHGLHATDLSDALCILQNTSIDYLAAPKKLVICSHNSSCLFLYCPNHYECCSIQPIQPKHLLRNRPMKNGQKRPPMGISMSVTCYDSTNS